VNWSIIAESFEGRTGKQCRERYNNHLQPNIKKGDWTPEEDLIIVEMQAKYGNHWSKITKMLPGRTDNAIKNRWHAAVRATSRGTYTKDCGLLSNIRRQPVIPRLQLDSIGGTENLSLLGMASLSNMDENIAVYKIEDSSKTALDSFQRHRHNSKKSGSAPVFEIHLDMAYDHTHTHVPEAIDDSDDSDSYSATSSVPYESSSKSSNHTCLQGLSLLAEQCDQNNNNEVLTARSNFSVNSIDLSTLITLIKGEAVPAPASTTTSPRSPRITQHVYNQNPPNNAATAEPDIGYEFDWQSPRFIDDRDRGDRTARMQSLTSSDERSSTAPRHGSLEDRLCMSLGSETWTPRLAVETPRLLDGRSLRLPDSSSSSRLPDGGPMLKRFRGIAQMSPSLSP